MKTKLEMEREVEAIVAGPARDAYPNDLIQGDVVVRRDIKGRKKYRVSHTGRSGGFVQVYTREVGSGSGNIVTFDRGQLKMA